LDGGASRGTFKKRGFGEWVGKRGCGRLGWLAKMSKPAAAHKKGIQKHKQWMIRRVEPPR